MIIETNEENFYKSSEISNFYEGKTIFISGAGGFLGKVLLEILLRCCPGIIRIYILLRPKSGLSAEDRKEKIFKREIFHKLLEKDPDALSKVFVVSGDVSQDNLGLCNSDIDKLINEVSIVFHCAASISFLKPLSFVMIQNVVGTDNVINLCQKLKKLEALVYTSTIFSNSNRKTDDIKEIVYKLPFKVEEALRLTRIKDEDGLNALFSKCNPNFPNYYTFSKCVVENLLLEKASNLPVSIVRPSLIICCLKGSLPGYVEDGSALINIALAIGKGWIHALQVYGTNRFEFIPADIAANTHVVAAFFQVTNSLPSPTIYNSTSGKLAQHTWKEFLVTITRLLKKYPLPNTYIVPSIRLCNKSWLYKYYNFIYHFVPAAIIDVLLWISGKKMKYLKLCRFQNQMLRTAEPFIKNQWDFACDNFNSLSGKMNEVDAKMFHVDVRDFRLEDWALNIYTGAPQYRVNNKPYKDTLSAFFSRYFITYLILFLVYGSIAILCYIMFF